MFFRERGIRWWKKVWTEESSLGQRAFLFLAFFLFVSTVDFFPQGTMDSPISKPQKRILFVCVENSCRSQMAEAFARRHGGDEVAVYSAGSRPSGRVHPRAVAFMRELGYDLQTHTSKGLTDIPPGEYDAAVLMGCGDACPQVRARRLLDWGIPDPKDLPPDQFRQVRDLIEIRVKQLLQELQTG